MKITNKEHAKKAVEAIELLDGIHINEKIMVLKSALAMIENQMSAELSAQIMFNALSKSKE